MGKTFKSRKYDLAVNTIDERDIDRLIAWLRKFPRLTMDAETTEFERIWAEWLGVKYSVACNSGSSANLLMYSVLENSGRTPKKKIVVPAAGWATTVSPAMQLGWQPIMCEVSPLTFGLDPDCLAKIVKREQPDAVMIVHLLGVPTEMRPIRQLQEKYGFELLEDCCGSHGSRHQGRPVGTFGAISSFSFYYGHHMSTIEGGMVCTDDEKLYHHLLMARNHGWVKELPSAERGRLLDHYGIDHFHSPFTFVVPGYNLRPTDLSSFIGRNQLPRLNETVRLREKNHRTYQKLLEGRLEFAPGVEGDAISSICFCAVARSTGERKAIVRALEEHEIDTRLFTAGNLGKHPFWFERFNPFSAPVADKLYSRGFFLPNNQTLREKDIECVCRVVRSAAESYRTTQTE